MDTSQSIPVSLVAFMGVAYGLYLLWCAIRAKGAKRWGSIVAFLAIFPVSLFYALALNPWLADARFRAFRSFYDALDEGMTRAEVFDVVEQQYPAHGKRGRPTLNVNKEEQIIFFMNTEDGSHTCEGVFVNLQDGIVTGVSYACD